MNNKEIKDKIRGSLIAGAAGDALGYAVEFDQLSHIKIKYGDHGIQHYKLKNGVAQISDDTQMTLFTAYGLIQSRCALEGSYADVVNLSYLEWYELQSGAPRNPCHSWLADVPAMSACRAPGRTCLAALADGGHGTIEKPINNSKGCGGIMRVAPYGLALNQNDKYGDKIFNLDRHAAESAALTHGHELGYMPAAAQAHIINRLVYWNMDIHEAVDDCLKEMQELFKDKEHLGDLLTLMNHAILCSKNNKTDEENIRALGEGWVAEETLAIALYCALKYPNDLSQALRAAVNHDGDSDSTGAVCGNIVGAIIGYENIPQEWKDNLECHDVILRVADELFGEKFENNQIEITDEKSQYDQYSQLLLERDEVKKEAEHWQSWYVRTFGNLVCRIFRQQVNCFMIRKAIEYYQKKLNHGEVVDVKEFEQYIIEVTKEYKEKLQAMVDEYEFEKDNVIKVLDDDQIKEIKHIYRRIVMMIHPDMNPDLAGNEKIADLWHRTVIAYKCNNLEELQEIEFQVNQLFSAIGMEAKKIEIPDISSKIIKLRNEIRKIINNDPYLYKQKYDTDEKIEKHWEELNALMDKFVNYQKELETHFSNLTNDLNFKPWQMN